MNPKEWGFSYPHSCGSHNVENGEPSRAEQVIEHEFKDD